MALSTTSRMVAKLRLADCKVGTVIGHDPKHGEFYYAIRLPKGIDAEYVGRHYASAVHGGRIARSKWEKDVVHVYVPGSPAFASKKNQRESVRLHAGTAAHLLDVVLRRVDEFDRGVSSCSSQHYIDTGRYLREEEVAEYQQS